MWSLVDFFNFIGWNSNSLKSIMSKRCNKQNKKQKRKKNNRCNGRIEELIWRGKSQMMNCNMCYRYVRFLEECALLHRRGENFIEKQ